MNWLFCTYCGLKFPEHALAEHQRRAHPDKPIQHEALRDHGGGRVEIIDVEPLEEEVVYSSAGRGRRR